MHVIPSKHTRKHICAYLLTCPEACIPESVSSSLILEILLLGKIYVVGSVFTIWQPLHRIIDLVHRIGHPSVSVDLSYQF